MPISEFHASTIVQVEASFGFGDFSCAPSQITETLGLQPDEIRVKGERLIVAHGSRTITVPFSSWSITSDSPSKDINDHIVQLLVRLRGAKAPFDPSWGEPSFGVLWKSNYLYAGNGPFYTPEVLGGIAAIKAALYQDIYQVDEPEPTSVPDTELQRIPRRHFTSR